MLPWTEKEVELTIISYFDMLSKEHRGERYKKTADLTMFVTLFRRLIRGGFEKVI